MNELEAAIQKLQLLIKFKVANTASQKALIISDQANDLDRVAKQVQVLLFEGKIHQNTDWAAHMTAGLSTDSLIGQILSSLHNGNLLSPELYPVLNTIKQQTLNWLCQLFDQQHGHFTSGASQGNLEALWQAKQRCPSRSIVYAAQTAHYSIDKACQILGLKLHRIPTDNEDKMALPPLQSACDINAPLAIIASAGTSSIGIFDPIDGCIQIAREFQAWCHIDAAWGGYLKLLPEHSALFGQQYAKANSLCFDPHKAWGQPKPASVLLYQQATCPMMSIEADYLQQQPDNILPGSQGGEAFLPLWFTLVSSGIDTLRHNSRHALEQARLFATLLAQHTNWPIFTSPSGIICFETDQNLERLIQQGILSVAKRNQKSVYRTVFTANTTKATAIIEKLRPYF
jgi:glutamate/tyrosine decarboxylase-like PLP-dependent enzyme